MFVGIIIRQMRDDKTKQEETQKTTEKERERRKQRKKSTPSNQRNSLSTTFLSLHVDRKTTTLSLSFLCLSLASIVSCFPSTNPSTLMKDGRLAGRQRRAKHVDRRHWGIEKTRSSSASSSSSSKSERTTQSATETETTD